MEREKVFFVCLESASLKWIAQFHPKKRREKRWWHESPRIQIKGECFRDIPCSCMSLRVDYIDPECESKKRGGKCEHFIDTVAFLEERQFIDES